jgi:hypothetical protein
MNRLSALLAAAAALVAVIGIELVQAPRGDSSSLQPRAATEKSPTSGLSVSHAADWVATILARPLFSPDRRPSAEAAMIADHTVSGLPRLSGIMVGPSGRSAIFAAHDSKPIVVAEGGRVGAYTIKSIDPDQVRLVGPHGAQILTPSFEQGPTRITQPVPIRAPLPR